jgi:hypothetical protein
MAPSAAPPIARAEGSPKAAASVACVGAALAGDGVAGTAGVERVAGAGAAGAGAAGVAAGALVAGVEGTEEAAEEEGAALGCFERVSMKGKVYWGQHPPNFPKRRTTVLFVPWRASRLGNPSLECCRTRRSCHLAGSCLEQGKYWLAGMSCEQ